VLPLLIATLEGEVDVHDVDSVYPLGRSFLRRAASRVAKAANPVAQVRNVSHGVARIGRATGRVGMQLSRGNVGGAFVDLGRAVTTTVATPFTVAVGAVDKSAGRKLEGVIARNDPGALLNRKILEAVKKAVRPIVSKFAGELDDGFGDESALRASLLANRSKILAASTAAGTAAGTAVAGPYGAPVGASLVPTAVDAVIDEMVAKARKAFDGAKAPTESASVEEPTATGGTSLKKPLLIGGGIAVGLWLLTRGR